MQSSLHSPHDAVVDSPTAISGGVEAMERDPQRLRPRVVEVGQGAPTTPGSHGIAPRQASAVSKVEPWSFMQKLGEILDPVDRALTRLGRKLMRVAGIVFGPAILVVEPLDAVLQRVAAFSRRVFEGAYDFVGRVVAGVPLPRIARIWLWVGDQVDHATSDSVETQWRNRYLSLLSLSVIASVFLHAALFRFAPTMQAGDVSVVTEELTSIELPPDIDIPPPPRQIARPAAPVIAATDLAEDVTIAPTTFDANPIEELPPPPDVQSTDTDQGGPAFTPFTVAPRISNAGEVAEIMQQEYPTLLRQAGIGGEVVVWVHITTEGIVEESRIFQSSGQPELDEAALRVARTVEFSPAFNRDQRVAVWIQFPLTFRVR